jgi:hypothetical protein
VTEGFREILRSKREVDAMLDGLGREGKRRVRRAVSRGEALADDREAAAAVLYAAHVRRFADVRRLLLGARWLRAIHAASVAISLGAGVWLALRGEWFGYLMLGGLAFAALYVVAAHFLLRRMQRRAARAEELNRSQAA